jgi:predicted DNA-binding helix-hairpin-helix protein
MEPVTKLQLFATQMHLEPAEEIDARPARSAPAPDKNQAGACGLSRKKSSLGIYHAALPGGKTKPILKTMLTSACERDCYYCPFRAGRDYRRATFKPDELASTYIDMTRAGLVDGIFLSSGILKGGAATQDRLLDTVAILREKHQYNGYIHLKIMPGAERDQVEQAMRLADRVSVNLEGPNTNRLQMLAPKKMFLQELLRPLQWAEEIRQSGRLPGGRHSWQRRWASTVTQFVVGAVGESDLELLSTTEYLFHRLHLRRTYFSSFSPVTDTPLENVPAENPWREHRLYQSSFLLRDYRFDMEELPFDAHGRLPLDRDPKEAWAQTHLREQPVEINRADREQLLRVPGIGPKGAARILTARRQGRLRELQDLRKIGVITGRMAPYVLLDGARPAQQLRLF